MSAGADGETKVDSGLWQLVYTSAAPPEFSPADLDDVLRVARERNLLLGVTGMLLYVESSFLQILEGDLHRLDLLFDHLQDDPRHTQVLLLLRAPIDQRSFASWTMGYSQVTFGEIQEASGVNQFFATPDAYADLSDVKLAKLLDRFRSGSFRQRIT
jgi:FAD-dependent sensor of blue light